MENIPKSKKEKKEDSIESKIDSKTKSLSNQMKKTNKTVKKKRARIIEPVDSSDDEDHLPVSLDFVNLIIFLYFYIYII
jgi:hypothetical protein